MARDRLASPLSWPERLQLSAFYACVLALAGLVGVAIDALARALGL